jgi:hypothetical protein
VWRWLRIVALMVAGLSCLAFLVAFWRMDYAFRHMFDKPGVPYNGIFVDDLRQEINSRLPIGSSREQVNDWIKSREFRVGELARDTPTIRNKSVGLYVTVPNQSPTDDAEIRIAFWFDDEDHLERVQVERFVYAL